MIKRWIFFLLAILIALQSVGAVIDNHQLHQSGQEHLSFEHEHERESGDLLPAPQEIVKNVEISPYDCHHCCHCHGTPNLYVSGFSCSFLLSFHQKKSFEYLLILPSILLFPALRPPIV